MRFFLPISLSMLALVACTSEADESSTSPGEAAPAGETPSAPPAAPSSQPPAAPTADVGAIYTISNDVSGNEVIVFHRGEDGALTGGEKYASGGLGTGNGLGSQGALALSTDGRFLVVVNPGSDDVTSFEVTATGLVARSRVASAGAQPVSVALFGDLVYVLNAAGNNISGFRLDGTGALTPIPSSSRPLSAGAAGGAQISFSASGDTLIVTEKATNVVDAYAVMADGTTAPGVAHPSAGKTPFGFAITKQGWIVVSEAFGAAAGASAVSSYGLDAQHSLSTISPSVLDHQTAACWVAVTADGKFAFTANTPNGNLSGYRVADNGSLTLLDAGISGVTGDGSKPADMTLDRSSRHLYVLTTGTHDIRRFDVEPDGTLVGSPQTVSVPATAAGLIGN